MAKSKTTYNKSIEILELSSGASIEEIKEAYRKLAKQYHPDVYQVDNGEKFKELSSAYRFLKKYPFPPVDPSYQRTQRSTYHPSSDDYSRKRKATYHRKKAQQKREVYLWMISKVKPFVLAVLVFNILLTLDYILPKLKEEKKIINYTMNGTRKSVIDYVIRYEYTILFDDYERRSFEVSEKNLVNRGDQYTLMKSFIFGITMELIHEKTKEELKPSYSIYRIFGILIPFVFVLQYLYFYRVKNYDIRLGFVAFMIVTTLIQIILAFFTY